LLAVAEVGHLDGLIVAEVAVRLVREPVGSTAGLVHAVVLDVLDDGAGVVLERLAALETDDVALRMDINSTHVPYLKNICHSAT
jgi:hypothetical protein